jgi:isoleucyl-tRNA synthetase
VHLELFPLVPENWRDKALEAKWERIHALRRVILGALEEARMRKEIGSSLEADPMLFVSDPELLSALEGVDMAEVCITSGMDIRPYVLAPDPAFRILQEAEAAVFVQRAEGRKCARSWKYSTEVGSDPEYPDLTPRDAEAMREYDAAKQAAE